MSKFKLFTTSIPTYGSYLIAVVALFLISLLFPEQKHSSYDYTVGKKWPSKDLVAAFDFAIQKSTIQIDQELQAIGYKTLPVYQYTPVNEEKATLIYDEIANKINTNSGLPIHRINDFNEQSKTIKANLAHVLRKGISLDKIPGNFITGATGRFTEKQGSQVYTTQEASNFILQTIEDEEIKEIMMTSLGLLLLPNYGQDSILKNNYKQYYLDQINTHQGLVKRNEIIIRTGEYITQQDHQKIQSYQIKYKEQIGEKGTPFLFRFGYFSLTFLILVALLMYIERLDEGTKDIKKILYTLLLTLFFCYLVYLVEKIELSSVYIVPICIVPILLKVFYGTRLALISHVCNVLIFSLLCSQGYEFTLISIIAGIVLIWANIQIRNWSQFFRSILLLLITYVISYCAFELIDGGSFYDINTDTLIAIGINVFLTLLAHPLIPLSERIFGYTSDLKLIELNDLNKPLLKELSIKAPGTLQHSLQVSNLAESAATAINANALLCKVAALYHDIGKIEFAEYFIENQNNGNPHDTLPPEESAKIIISHVKDGVRKAKKAGLPKIIIDFIETHHGTTRTEYFYRRALDIDPNTNPALYTYPGPLPQTKEQVILLLADSIEAASKSLQEYTEESISQLVEKIVLHKIELQQLTAANITLQEIEICKKAFKSILKSIYHVRVSYPEKKA